MRIIILQLTSTYKSRFGDENASGQNIFLGPSVSKYEIRMRVNLLPQLSKSRKTEDIVSFLVIMCTLSWRWECVMKVHIVLHCQVYCLCLTMDRTIGLVRRNLISYIPFYISPIRLTHNPKPVLDY